MQISFAITLKGSLKCGFTFYWVFDKILKQNLVTDRLTAETSILSYLRPNQSPFQHCWLATKEYFEMGDGKIDI